MSALQMQHVVPATATVQMNAISNNKAFVVKGTLMIIHLHAKHAMLWDSVSNLGNAHVGRLR
jgi:hypothetical protein